MLDPSSHPRGRGDPGDSAVGDGTGGRFTRTLILCLLPIDGTLPPRGDLGSRFRGNDYGGWGTTGRDRSGVAHKGFRAVLWCIWRTARNEHIALMLDPSSHPRERGDPEDSAVGDSTGGRFTRTLILCLLPIDGTLPPRGDLGSRVRGNDYRGYGALPGWMVPGLARGRSRAVLWCVRYTARIDHTVSMLHLSGHPRERGDPDDSAVGDSAGGGFPRTRTYRTWRFSQEQFIYYCFSSCSCMRRTST
jgi:hypothetical protein